MYEYHYMTTQPLYMPTCYSVSYFLYVLYPWKKPFSMQVHTVMTGWEPLEAAVSFAPHSPVKHHYRNVCRLGHLHRHSLRKLFVHFHLSLPLYLLDLRCSFILTNKCCFWLQQESRDPRKLHWLFEMLMESPVNGEGGSFVDAWWAQMLLP